MKSERLKEVLERRQNPYLLPRKSSEYLELERRLREVNQEVKSIERNLSYLSYEEQSRDRFSKKKQLLQQRESARIA